MMRRLLAAAIVGGMSCLPMRADAVEIVVNAPDLATVVSLAQQMGYVTVDPVTKKPVITTQGEIAAGGSYFVNMVGVVQQPTGATQPDGKGNQAPVMAALPGIWFRLRHNGDPAAMPAVPAAAAAAGVVIYRLVTPADGAPFWSNDGVTPAPDYVGGIGVIL